MTKKMHLKLFLYIVAAILILGLIMPQQGQHRKYYIILMTAVHWFVTAFRYEHMTGDLMKYHYLFNQYENIGWLSEEMISQGRNTGFHLLNKLVYELTDGDFRTLLVVIAVITYLIVGYVVYRYSTAPWFSFLLWDCMTFFFFGFSAIRQVIAMAFVMLAFVGIMERKRRFFLLSMIVAGLMHTPALIFLPAYWLCQRRINTGMLIFYFVLGSGIFVFKNQFITIIRSFYYEEDWLTDFSGDVGSRFIMILGFALFGILLRGLSDRLSESLFHIMIIAAILQMLAGFDNVLTRLTDFYYQFVILYLPAVFLPDGREPVKSLIRPMFPFNKRSLKFMSLLVALFVLWYYWSYSLNGMAVPEADSAFGFRFMWDVAQ